MSFDYGQFRRLIEEVLRSYPALESPAAVNLLLGTAAQESAFGTYLWQRGGLALGVFQMEPETFNWLQTKYGRKYPYLAIHKAEDLPFDLRLAVLSARLRYRPVREPLPPAGDILALARYWKQNYNTALGAGTIEQFQANYKKYVKEV